ncbi:MAG: Gfo/Idh/MocA family oxidoreductase [Alphaproteobacteria bacterium]|nr:Gfo/Idh/MocA family oxidoreductase [Alphaproteobacteria bacterium]
MAHGIALIGLGIMGRRMIGRLVQHGGFRIAAMWDPSPEACAAAAREAPGAAIAAGPEAIMARADVGCVYIASPPASHPALCHLAFDAGKAVFCEKPLTHDMAAGEALAARVAREARPAAVNFSFASSASFQAIVDAARAGSLGTLRRIEVSASFARWPRDWQQAGPWLGERIEGGFAREVLSHFVFATQRLAGPLALRDARVSWPADGRSAETALVATLSGGGIEVAIDAAVRGDVSDTNLWTVTGERGAIRMRDWYALERRGADGGWAPAMPGGVEDLRAQAGQRQLDQLAALLEGRPQTLATFDEALAVQRSIEAMLAA